MAIIGDTNNDLSLSSASAAEGAFIAKTFLKANGWTVLASGDATDYFADSDGLTVQADLENTDAWYVIQSPNGGWQLLYRQGNAGFRGYYSFSMTAAYSDGGGAYAAADASTPWGAPDEEFIFGAANAVGSFSAGATSDEWHVVTTDEPVEGHYPLYLSLFDGTTLNHAIGVDVMFGKTRHPEIPTPLIGWQHNGSNFVVHTMFFPDINDLTEVKYGNLSQRYGQGANSGDLYQTEGSAYTDAAIISAQGASNELMYPFAWFATGTPLEYVGSVYRFLGVSALMRHAQTASVTHAYPDRSNASSDEARVYMTPSILLPWPTDVVPS